MKNHQIPIVLPPGHPKGMNRYIKETPAPLCLSQYCSQLPSDTSTDGWADEKDVVHVYKGILLNYQNWHLWKHG